MALTSDRNPFFGSGLDGLGETPISTDVAAVENLLRLCPVAAATSLHDKAEDAARMGLGSLHVKDERERMGMGSFKALGAAFVIAREADAARRKAGDDLAWEEALRGRTFLTASAGNHGLRWWQGHVFWCASVIYLSQTVPASFAERLRGMGARWSSKVRIMRPAWPPPKQVPSREVQPSVGFHMAGA